MSQVYYFGRKAEDVKEGGMARDNAIYEYLKKYNLKFIEIKDNSKIVNKIYNLLSVIFIFTKKNKKIFILYPNLGTPLQGSQFLRNFYLKLLKFGAERNEVFVDISDLPIEQNRDLRLGTPPLFYREVEKILFSGICKYIFASYQMRDYIIKKYKIKENLCIVCVNGGNETNEYLKLDNKIKNILSDPRIKFVYAGTLNQRRNIEKMLEIFNDEEGKILILMGINGNWIKDKNYKNVIYLGSRSQEECQKIVSLCNIGLIPYDESLEYYNIAYPTKLSFYITAGIPFLSTPVDEVKNIVNKYKFGFLCNIENWKGFIKTLNFDQLYLQNEVIENSKKYFYWKNIFKPLDEYI